MLEQQCDYNRAEHKKLVHCSFTSVGGEQEERGIPWTVPKGIQAFVLHSRVSSTEPCMLVRSVRARVELSGTTPGFEETSRKFPLSPAPLRKFGELGVSETSQRSRQ
eukprot:1823957-Rhodomonas_salina.2